MYTKDKGTEQRVAKEQQYVKEKGEEVIQAVSKVRSGEASIPSTERVSEALERGEKALESLQMSERGRQLNDKERVVLEDMQRVLEDEVAILQKNEGDIIQNIVRHGWTLVQGLNGDPAFKTIFDNWHNLAGSIVGGGDIKGLLSSGGELMKALKDTEEFLDLASQLISILQEFISEKTDQVVEGKTDAHFPTQAELDMARDRLISSLRVILSNLSTNYIWCDMVCRGRNIANRGKAVGEEAKEGMNDILEQAFTTENAKCLAEDIRILIQRLAGETVNVDPLFDYSKAAWYDITHNEELSQVLYQLQADMQQIAQNPQMADDPELKSNLKDLSSRAEKALTELKESENITRAKEESQKVVNAIKNDPTNRRLVSDIKQLWDDVRSDRPGELIDPALLADLRKVVIPMFLEHLENVPIPPIHGTTEFLFGKYEYNVENIHVSIPALVPDDIHIRVQCDLEADPMRLTAHNQRTYVFIEVRDIQIHLHNVNWSYARLTIPHTHDAGVVDIDTKGHGVSIHMKLEIKGDISKQHLLDVLGVRCDIDKWDVKVTESKHNFMYQTLSHVFGSAIRREVQKTVEKKLKQFGSVANEQLMNLLHQAKEKSHEVSRKATEKLESVKETATAAKEKALNRVQELRNDNEGVANGVKDDVKEHGKGVASYVAEKACEILSKQQEKIDRRRANIMLGRQRLDNSNNNLGDSSSIPPTPPPSPMSPSLQRSTASLADSSSIPTAEVEPYIQPLPSVWTLPPPPSLGYDVYPDVPSIAGGNDDAKSTASDVGSENDVACDKLDLSGEIAQQRVNEQGTSQI